MQQRAQVGISTSRRCLRRLLQRSTQMPACNPCRCHRRCLAAPPRPLSLRPCGTSSRGGSRRLGRRPHPCPCAQPPRHVGRDGAQPPPQRLPAASTARRPRAPPPGAASCATCCVPRRTRLPAQPAAGGEAAWRGGGLGVRSLALLAAACRSRPLPLPADFPACPSTCPPCMPYACLPALRRRWSWLADPRDAQGRRPSDPDHDPTTLLVPPAAWREDLKGAEAQVGWGRCGQACGWLGWAGSCGSRRALLAALKCGAPPAHPPTRRSPPCSTGASSRAAPTWCCSFKRARLADAGACWLLPGCRLGGAGR